MTLRISMGLGDHIEYRGRTWGSSSTLGTHRSCGNPQEYGTLSGKPPVVIARGGFSGVFQDSSNKAYELVSVTISLNVALWCDLQLAKDGVGICFLDLNLDNGSDVTGV
ncbi:hypothetical protein YC2023_019160 [Brassica napus]